MADNRTLNPDELVWVNPDYGTSARPDRDLQGIKESEGKLTYDLDFAFIKAMAERQDRNTKYPEGNWKKPINVADLEKALKRHVMEVLIGNYEDETEFGHLVAIANNAMMIWYQKINNELHSR